MSETKRITISFPPELEEKLVALRKTDRFCRMSWAEIIRILISTGLQSCDGQEENG